MRYCDSVLSDHWLSQSDRAIPRAHPPPQSASTSAPAQNQPPRASALDTTGSSLCNERFEDLVARSDKTRLLAWGNTFSMQGKALTCLVSVATSFPLLRPAGAVEEESSTHEEGSAWLVTVDPEGCSRGYRDGCPLRSRNLLAITFASHTFLTHRSPETCCCQRLGRSL